MSHLADNIAEFVFEELSPEEMTAARRHVAQCLECQGAVASFSRVRHSLEQLPEVDLPRRLVFVSRNDASISRSRQWFRIAWAVSGAVAALLLVALALAGGLQVQWSDQGVQVALGEVTPEAVPVEPPVTIPAPVDYEALLSVIRQEQESLLDAGLDQRLAALDNLNGRELQRLRGDLAVLFELQRVMERDTVENSRSIQLLARRSEVTE